MEERERCECCEFKKGGKALKKHTYTLTMDTVRKNVWVCVEVVVERGGSSLSGPHHKERGAARR